MEKSTIPHNALVLVGDGLRAVFLRNSGTIMNPEPCAGKCLRAEQPANAGAGHGQTTAWGHEGPARSSQLHRAHRLASDGGRSIRAGDCQQAVRPCASAHLPVPVDRRAAQGVGEAAQIHAQGSGRSYRSGNPEGIGHRLGPRHSAGASHLASLVDWKKSSPDDFFETLLRRPAAKSVGFAACRGAWLRPIEAWRAYPRDSSR
jgi:hypothetical protein